MTLRLCTFLLAVTLSAAPLSAQNTASTESIVATVAAKSANALALIRVRLHDEMMTGNVEGLGFCVAADGEKALLITLALDPRINSQTISAIDVVVPGFDGTLKGKFRSADPVSGIAFIDVEGPFKWNAIQFEPTADLSAGKLVASAALLDANLGYEPFYGVGYVSSILQIPGRTAFVTGGSLTNVGSPVFNQQGRAIGIVQQQLPMIQQIVSGDQPRNIAVRSMHESRYFVPVEEFIEVLQDPPAPGKRLPWIGVLEYAPAPKDLLDALNLKQPAVMAVKIDPEGPAARAGLEPKDIIIALNGKPLAKMPSPQLAMQRFLHDFIRCKPNSKVSLTVLRMGQRPVVIETTTLPSPMMHFEAKRVFADELGMLVREKAEMDYIVDSSAAGKLQGLVVVGMLKDSPAAIAGMRVNDLIARVDDQPVAHVDEFKARLSRITASNRAVKLTIQRNDDRLVFTVDPVRPASDAPK